jgi:hypothetical protein
MRSELLRDHVPQIQTKISKVITYEHVNATNYVSNPR